MSKQEKTGEPKTLPVLSYEPRNSSLGEWLAAEKFFLESGLVTSTLADNLFAMAYAQRGVERVELEFHTEGDQKIVFKLRLDPTSSRRMKELARLSGRGGLIAKLRMIYLLKRGAPDARKLEQTLKFHASQLLPEGFQVEVHVE